MFSWSLPFLAEKVTSMLYNILKQCSPAELKSMDEVDIPEEMKHLIQTDDSQLQVDEQKTKRKLMLKSKI